jgi:uncharacterized membrane protein YecN with MAPEG domain
MLVTPLYAALLALLFLILSARVILYRRANNLNLGDEGDRQLLKRMRAQGNCAEYAPLGLLLLLLAEMQGAPAMAVHFLGLALLVGRVVHAVGLSSNPQKLILRQIGMVLTVTMIAVTALGLIAHWLV